MLNTFDKGGALNVMIESPRGSAVKFKYDAAKKVMGISRPLPRGLVYPYDWGFVVATRAPDGDPMDAVVVWDGTSYPGIVMPCRLVGALKAEQNSRNTKRRERNDRLIVLPVDAPRHSHVKSVLDLPRREREELEQFFLHAVFFEDKDLRFLGWTGPDEARTLLQGTTRRKRAPRRK